MDLYGGGLGIGKVMLILGSCAWGDEGSEKSEYWGSEVSREWQFCTDLWEIWQASQWELNIQVVSK